MAEVEDRAAAHEAKPCDALIDSLKPLTIGTQPYKAAVESHQRRPAVSHSSAWQVWTAGSAA